MNIRIGNLTIEHQAHNSVTVSRIGKVTDEKSKNFGEPTKTFVGSYANTKNALCAVLECKIAPLDVCSISGVIKAIDEAKAEIISAVESYSDGDDSCKK